MREKFEENEEKSGEIRRSNGKGEAICYRVRYCSRSGKIKISDRGRHQCRLGYEEIVVDNDDTTMYYFSFSSFLVLLQIPTRTGAVVHAFHLHVASPQAVILGGQVSHVDILTPSLTLVCIVDNVNNQTGTRILAIRPFAFSYWLLAPSLSLCALLAENPTLLASLRFNELILCDSSARARSCIQHARTKNSDERREP